MEEWKCDISIKRLSGSKYTETDRFWERWVTFKCFNAFFSIKDWYGNNFNISKLKSVHDSGYDKYVWICEIFFLYYGAKFQFHGCHIKWSIFIASPPLSPPGLALGYLSLFPNSHLTTYACHTLSAAYHHDLLLSESYTSTARCPSSFHATFSPASLHTPPTSTLADPNDEAI